MNYNLLEEEWIPVLSDNGVFHHLNAIETLKQAEAIRCITLATPLDLFATHRFLLTLLYWKAHLTGGVEQVRAAVLKDEKIPYAVLNGIIKESHSFNLFDENSPFLQDPSAGAGKEKITDKKSVGSLFTELASGTNIAHFHHGDDENMRLCLQCVALGMIRVVPWTQAGGSGLSPSVHNAPPIMAIATGDNLAITLGLNLVDLDVEQGEANWFGHFMPTDRTRPIPYLEAFTWNPRRIFLTPPEKCDCWYCGQADVPTVGKIFYAKNENTKLNKKGKKTIPFLWKDPSAFYKDNEYITAKSANEKWAMSNHDLKNLADNNSIHKSIVDEKNPNHEGWLLVIPCTDPANNKTYDHRQLEPTNLSPETIRALLPPVPPADKKVLYGWNEPKIIHPHGIKQFFHAALTLLTHNDWAILANAANRPMSHSPAAFGVFTGLYWGLRDKKTKGLPPRNVAWLMLKLMASVPARVRALQPNAAFCPIIKLPTTQIEGKARGRESPYSISLYPVSFQRGHRLEATLRDELYKNMRKRNPKPVDWIGLCYCLDKLID